MGTSLSRDEIYKASLTGRGTPLIDEVALRDIVSIGKERGLMIAALEVYRIEGEMEIPCVEYGIYGGEIDPEIENLSESQRIDFLENELSKTFDLLNKDLGEYKFMLWMVEAKD